MLLYKRIPINIKIYINDAKIERSLAKKFFGCNTLP